MESERLAITCGGTGGHFYPGLTIAREQKARGRQVILLLSGINSDVQAKIAGSCGIDCCILPHMPHWKKSPLKFGRGLFGGISQSYRKLKEFKPDALLGMGSFASLPPIIGAKLLQIPVFLHDGNARIGKANRILSRAARHLAVAFDPVNQKKVKCPCTVTGMPVRPELLKNSHLDKTECIARINQLFSVKLSTELPTILVFGGSQGAEKFNQCFPEAFKRNQGCRFQVIHLTGKGKLSETKRLYENCTFPRLIIESSEEMQFFLGAGDLVICRSGGSSIAELMIFGCPAILIPYFYAAEGHQQDNADFLTSRDAAICINNQELTQNTAEEQIRKFLDQPEYYRQLGINAEKLAKPEAAQTILDLIGREIQSMKSKRSPVS